VPSPTATPQALIVSPAALSLIGTGPSYALTFGASESGDTGTLTESNTCGGIAAVTPAVANGPAATFTVTGSASGTCSVTVADTHGQTATVAVTITVSGAVVY
jgi:hypothetical protein